jgi:type II secretory pathway pseudopilin PulG
MSRASLAPRRGKGRDEKRRGKVTGVRAIRESGWTLIEVIIILILVGIVAAVAVPRYIDLGSRASINTTRTKLENIRRAIVGDPSAVSGGRYSAQGFWGDRGVLPTTLTDLVVKGGQPTYDKYTRRGWNGPYVDTQMVGVKYQAFVDAWNNDIAYATVPPATPTARTFTLTSPGPPGGSPITISVTF